MKILLINSNTKRLPWPIIPIGLCYIATNAEHAGHQVSFLDLTFSADIEKAVKLAIEKHRPVVIGVSVRNIDNNTWRDTAFYPKEIDHKIIKVCKSSSSATLVIGGAALGINAKELLEYFDVKYVIQGDGEEAFLSFLKVLEGDCDFSKVQGLVYKKGDRIINNGYLRTNNLDSRLFAKAYKWINYAQYDSLNGCLGIQTKKGCSLKCTYCAYPSIEGTKYRLRSPKNIVDEIEEMVVDCKPSIIEFLDSTFNIPLTHAIDICDELIKRKLNVDFRAMSISPSAINEELFTKMKKARFIDIDINPESASPITLKTLGKTFTIEQLIETTNLVKKLKIPTMWFFLFGAPGESEKTIQENFDFIDRYIPKDHLCVVSAGVRINSHTGIMQETSDRGLLPSNINLLFPFFYECAEMPKEKLLYLVNREVINRPNCIYLKEDSYRPDYLIKMVRQLTKLFKSKRPIWQYEIMLSSIAKRFGITERKLNLHDKQYQQVCQQMRQ